MAPNPKILAAVRAMANLGIEESKVKPVLKKLYKLYDKNWELIEEGNYRALADAIFEAEEFKGPDQSNTQNEEEMESEEAQMHVESARPLKRLRLREQQSQPLHAVTDNTPYSAASPSKKARLEKSALAEGHSGQQPQNKAASSDGNVRLGSRSGPMRDTLIDKGKKPASPQVAVRGGRHMFERASPPMPSKAPIDEPHCNTLMIPKDEPVDEWPVDECPIAVIPPEPSSLRDSSKKNDVTGKQGGHVSVASPQRRDTVKNKDVRPSSNEEVTSNVVIASSASGEVKLSLSCNIAHQGPDLCMPSQEQFLKRMEDKCMQSYKISDPSFSVAKLLRDICDCMLDFTDSNNDSHGSKTRSGVDASKELEAHGTLSNGEDKDLDTLSHSSNGSIQVNSFSALVSPRSPFSPVHQSSLDDAVLVSKMYNTNGFSQKDVQKEPENPMSPNSHSLVVVPQHQLTPDDIRSIHDVNDLTKGEESVQISWVNETTNDFPPSFNYIPQNLVFQDARVNISLSRIGTEDCCTCIGNCVLPSATCSCINKIGGDFVYTAEGLVKEEYLDECIAISRNPQQHYFYCKDCPLERSKNDGCLEPCKGHLKRKFIKECWSKCGCGKQCGNRVIQRGITFNLQVFFTSEEKGWGLRTLEDLPKGAFVCEFVGEILTVKELHERNMKHTENGKHTCPIILDADWDSGFVKGKEALCLDAASFGNIARFINHRCFDANLVEIPIEVECPDRHYYHLALFTSRKIAAQEELTWDYGIDFDDLDQPAKVFQCRCGSKFCRNMKRSNRSVRCVSNA